MITVISLMFSYLYTNFLYLSFYTKILGIKYSLKACVYGAVGLSICGWLIKIVPQYLIGTEVTAAASLLMLVSNFIYAFIFFGASVKRKLLSTIMYTFVQATMDMLGLRIAGMITGNYELTMTNVSFTVVAMVCSCAAITLGTYLIVWIWKIIEQREWKYEKYQGMCIIWPISQYFILQSMGMRYSISAEPLPIIVIVGFIFGILTDIYMFFLFDRLNSKNQTESELKRMKHQYELEQMRYEQLKAGQEETEKIRHDFQNYILILKQME